MSIFYDSVTWSISSISEEERGILNSLLPDHVTETFDGSSYTWRAGSFTPATVDLGDVEAFQDWIQSSEEWRQQHNL